jgi:gluconolactonase
MKRFYRNKGRADCIKNVNDYLMSLKQVCFIFLLLYNQTGLAQYSKFKMLDHSFLQLVDTTQKVQTIAGGFSFLEGPLWSKKGYLLVSDLRVNKIYKIGKGSKPEVLVERSGFTGTDTAGLAEDYGSNGLAYDKQGNILVCQHGDHAIAMITKDGTMRTVVDRYKGKRLNSPDDLAVKRDGSIYFTDPPFGFRDRDKGSRKALEQNGIYLYKNNRLTLLSTDYRYPNGITFSPDEKYLYVCSYDLNELMRRYEIATDGTLKNGKIFSTTIGDGLKVDSRGNVYLCNWQGVHIFSPKGKEIGLITLGEQLTNFNWGDEDYQSLYIVAASNIYKVRTKVGGIKR